MPILEICVHFILIFLRQLYIHCRLSEEWYCCLRNFNRVCCFISCKCCVLYSILDVIALGSFVLFVFVGCEIKNTVGLAFSLLLQWVMLSSLFMRGWIISRFYDIPVLKWIWKYFIYIFLLFNFPQICGWSYMITFVLLVLIAFSKEIKSIFHNTFEKNKVNMRYPLPSRNGHWFYTTEVANVTCISSEIQHLSILTNVQHVYVYIKQINCK